MNAQSYWLILVASLAGALTGVLVMWNRRRAQVSGESWLRRATVLAFGTAASGCALVAFVRVAGDKTDAQAAVVVILVTGWVAVVQSAIPLPLPRPVFEVRAWEWSLLRRPWIGVGVFGSVLRGTPLRHLGGRVYLAGAGRDPGVVLRGIREAEAVHLWALVASCPWLILWGAQGRWMSVLWGVAAHLPLNVYPVLHLRRATWRIQRHLARPGWRQRGPGGVWAVRNRVISS